MTRCQVRPDFGKDNTINPVSNPKARLSNLSIESNWLNRFRYPVYVPQKDYLRNPFR
jgi:hypothetical protein